MCVNIVRILSGLLVHAHCRVVNSFVLQQWKIFWRQSNEKIRLQLVCPSSHNNLPLSLCFSVAGAALMDISEVHKRVHLELEENVSAKLHKSFVPSLYAFPQTATQLLLCSCTGSPFTRHHACKSFALYVCVRHRLPLHTTSTSLGLKTPPFLVLTFHQVKQRNREFIKERKGTGFDCWVTCCSVTFLENSRQALTCPGKTASTVTLGTLRWWALI